MHCYYFHAHKLFSLHAKSIGLRMNRMGRKCDFCFIIAVNSLVCRCH